MNTGLCAAITGFDLLQMHAPVHAFEQHGVHLAAQRRDVGDEFDLPLGAQLFGELVDARVRSIPTSGLPPLYAATTRAPGTWSGDADRSESW